MNKQRIEAIAVTIDLDKAIVMTQTEIYKFIEEVATSIFDKIEEHSLFYQICWLQPLQ